MNGIQGPCLGDRRDWIGPDREIWDRFWQAGRRASCYQDENGRYLPAIRERWWAYLRELGPSAHLLDIGTGNGAVAEEIAACAHSVRPRAWILDAVDSAEIRPPAITGPGLTVHFHRRTDCRQLPFEDHRYDRLTAQFTLEYLPLAECLPELRRVLGPSGRIRAICHVRNGVSERLARRELSEIESIRRVELLPCTRRVVEQPSPRQLMDLSQRADDLSAEHGPTALLIPLILNNLEHLYAAREQRGVAAVAAAVERVNEELLAHRQRLLWLVEAAVDGSRQAAIRAALHSAGFQDIRFEPITTPNGALLALQIDARR